MGSQEEPSEEPRPGPDLKRALRPVPTYERAVREVSKMLAAAGIRHALVGGLRAAVQKLIPEHVDILEKLVRNVDRAR